MKEQNPALKAGDIVKFTKWITDGLYTGEVISTEYGTGGQRLINQVRLRWHHDSKECNVSIDYIEIHD